MSSHRIRQLSQTLPPATYHTPTSHIPYTFSMNQSPSTTTLVSPTNTTYPQTASRPSSTPAPSTLTRPPNSTTLHTSRRPPHSAKTHPVASDEIRTVSPASASRSAAVLPGAATKHSITLDRVRRLVPQVAFLHTVKDTEHI